MVRFDQFVFTNSTKTIACFLVFSFNYILFTLIVYCNEKGVPKGKKDCTSKQQEIYCHCKKSQKVNWITIKLHECFMFNVFLKGLMKRDDERVLF